MVMLQAHCRSMLEPEEERYKSSCGHVWPTQLLFDCHVTHLSQPALRRAVTRYAVPCCALAPMMLVRYHAQLDAERSELERIHSERLARLAAREEEVSASAVLILFLFPFFGGINGLLCCRRWTLTLGCLWVLCGQRWCV